MYRSQVDRFVKEIASLEKKAADERSYATRAHGDALRLQNSISSSTSESMLRAKLRDIQRHEEKAGSHEKRAAQYSEQIAGKRRSLTSAESSLARAVSQAQQKDERAAKQRREDEVRHVRELERARRDATHSFPASLAARPSLCRVVPLQPKRVPSR